MPLVEAARYAVSAALTVTLVWAAVSDIRTRRIPNRSVLVVLGLFAAWAVTAPGALPGCLVTGALAFIAGYVLYAFNIVGAGDAKLFAAVALFAGLNYFGPFAMGTVLSGGLMALISLASEPRRALVMFSMRGQGEWRGIPYGAAIAIGGILMQWGQVLGQLTPNSVLGFPTH